MLYYNSDCNETNEMKILDCTIRDGGLTNDSYFSLDTVRAVYQAVCRSGIDYVELGYRNSKEILSPAEYGPWRFCDEEQLRKVVEGIEPLNTKISIMQDAHMAVPKDILPKAQSVVDLIRIATYLRDMDKAVVLARNATNRGYECTINIMAISQEELKEIEISLQKIESETDVQCVYIVDSFGALYPDDVHRLIEIYKKNLKNKKIGLHFHNSQQLAFANTLLGIKEEVHFIDGTLYGLGRAAGNCPIELLVGYLQNTKYDILPLLEVIQKEILILKEEIKWGYHIPYMLTGILKKHPRKAMSWMKRSQKDDFITFYKSITDKC